MYQKQAIYDEDIPAILGSPGCSLNPQNVFVQKVSPPSLTQGKKENPLLENLFLKKFSEISVLPIETKEKIDTADLMLRYADFYRQQFDKRQRGEIATDMALNMILNKWHKDNQTNQTAMSWSRLPSGYGTSVNVSEFNKQNRDAHVVSLIREDKNFVKDSRAIPEMETLESKRQELIEEIKQLDNPDEVLSKKKQLVKSIIKERTKKTTDDGS